MEPIRDYVWWAADYDKKHERLWDVVTRLRRAQDYRRMNDLLHASLYGNVSLTGFAPQNYGRAPAGAHGRLSLNVVKNMTSAVISKIAAKNKVKPTFITQGGNYALKRKARNLEKLVSGVFYDLKVYRKQLAIMRDACVFGTGALKIYTDEECTRIHAERVPIWELLTDDAESIYGEPRCLYHRRYYDRLVLAAMFPQLREQIRLATQDQEDNAAAPDLLSDYIPVVEAWHLPSGPDANDGRRVMALNNVTLVDEPYEREGFPFALLRWSEDPAGFFGVGLAYELLGIQAEINDLLEEIQRAHRLIKGHYLVEHNSKVILTHLNDDLAAIVRYAGVAPMYQAPTAIAPDVYQHLWNLYQKAYEISGISQLSAQSAKPAGLNSGVALREYDDIQTERFLEVGTRLEDWTLDVAEQVVERARDISEANGFKVKARSKNFIETIDFREVDMKADEYVLQVFPTSMLPSTPAGRIAFVQDMINSKMVEPEDGFELIDFPDTEQYAARRNARRRLLERNIEEIIEKGEWVAPEPNDDHDLTLREMPSIIAQARLDGVEPDTMDLLYRYETLSQRLQTMGQPPPAAPPAAPPQAGAPPGAPPAPMQEAA